MEDKRVVLAAIIVDDAKAKEEDVGTLDYLEKQSFEMAGCEIDRAMIMDTDDPQDVSDAYDFVHDYVGSDERCALLDRLLDDRCDAYGVRNTIAYLIDLGLSKDQILDLNFDDGDVDHVFKNPDEEYDCK